MGTYQTTEIPGVRAGRRLFGLNSAGQAAFLSRLLPQSEPLARELPGRLRPTAPPDSPWLATLVELGAANGWLHVVEKALVALPIEVVLAAARAANEPLAPELCAWFAARVSEAAASLGEYGHLRLSLENVLVRPVGEPYLLGASWARLLPAAPGEPVPEWLAPGRERQADAFAAAELARQLATLGAPAGPEDWGVLPTSLKAIFSRAAGGGLSSAALTSEIDSALRSWDRHPGAAGVAAWLQRLALPTPAAIGADGPRLVLEPAGAEPEEQAWSQLGPALGIDGRVERPERPLQLEPLAASVEPAAPSPEGSELEFDERAFAHAFGPAPAQDGGPRRARPRLGRWVGAALVLALAAAGSAGAWNYRGELARWLESHLPRERPRGDWGTAMLRIDSSPSGAEIRLGDELLGQTPYVGDNDLPPGEYRVRLLKQGFREASISFEGAKDAHLSVPLRPR